METGIKVKVTGYLNGSSIIDSKYSSIVLGLLNDNQFEFDEDYNEDDEFDEADIEEINSILRHVQSYDYDKLDESNYNFDVEGDFELAGYNKRYVDDNYEFEFEYDFDEVNNSLIFDARFEYEYILEYEYSTLYEYDFELDGSNLFDNFTTTGVIENDGEYFDDNGDTYERYKFIMIDENFIISEMTLEDGDDYVDSSIPELKEEIRNNKEFDGFDKIYKIDLFIKCD